jgi:hypothetical protein
MSDRRAVRIILALTVAGVSVACGYSEQGVVDQYFNAINAQDTQTLASFSAAKFDKKVDNWKITAASEETRTPAQLGALIAKVNEIDGAMGDNKKAYNAYFLDHPKEVDQVRDLLKKEDPKIPASLQSYADQWQKFIDKEQELKKSLAEAKDAVERERHNMSLSVGNLDDLESLTGDMVTKTLDLNLTIGGQVQPYVMSLHKYDVQGTGAGRIVSRWVVQTLTPKA